MSKKNLSVTIDESGRLVAGGESFHIGDPVYRAQLCELLSQGGMHITDAVLDREVLAIEDDPAAEYFKSFEPEVPEDLNENLLVLEDDPEADVFLEFVSVYAYGTVAERENMTQLLSEMSYPQLAQMALLAIKRAGVEEGRDLMYAISANSPDLFEEMQRVAGVA